MDVASDVRNPTAWTVQPADHGPSELLLSPGDVGDRLEATPHTSFDDGVDDRVRERAPAWSGPFRTDTSFVMKPPDPRCTNLSLPPM